MAELLRRAIFRLSWPTPAVHQSCARRAKAGKQRDLSRAVASNHGGRQSPSIP